MPAATPPSPGALTSRRTSGGGGRAGGSAGGAGTARGAAAGVPALAGGTDQRQHVGELLEDQRQRGDEGRAERRTGHRPEPAEDDHRQVEDRDGETDGLRRG